MDACNVSTKRESNMTEKKPKKEEGERQLTWFIMVESLDPSWIFFSRMFNSFTSLSEGIYNNRSSLRPMIGSTISVQLKSLYLHGIQYPAGNAHGLYLGRLAA